MGLDIIKGHFGLPDRQLACNVASRLIDCSLYRHVSGPSGGLGDVCVVDSNEDIYTLTPDAHAMMNSIHGSDRSRAAIPTQLKTPRPTTMRPSATARVTPASINILIPPTRVTAAEISSAPARNMPLPPPVDTSESEQSTHSDSVAAHVHSPSDTLVTRATSSETTKREFVPQTPTTVCLSPSVQESGESSHSANTGSSSSLQNVQIPDSNLEGLLNSWSFISESYQSTSNSHALRASVPSTPKPPQSPLVDLPDPRRRTTPLDSPGSSVKGKMSMDSDLDEDLPSDDDGEGWAKHAVRVRRRWAVYNMEQANNPRRSSGSARHYPSAPSLFDHI
ncbi:hypothetical protein FBU59_002106 [Linderina macrospora]|uniref:Uncharacterized protein n=1 Tax=Linderina macrospora TaxID=4868 RepID=A0ACC1JCF7_9FUNG|nr:hypothetical protein FBU59_002106 [Linderina macrospora]